MNLDKNRKEIEILNLQLFLQQKEGKKENCLLLKQRHA